MSVPPMTEAQFQTVVLDMARLLGWWVAHFRPARTEAGWRTAVTADGAGFPDLVLTRERVVFAELKSQRGRLSPRQRIWIARLRQAGAEVHLWRPSDLDDIEQLLRTKVPA